MNKKYKELYDSYTVAMSCVICGSDDVKVVTMEKDDIEENQNIDKKTAGLGGRNVTSFDICYDCADDVF